MTERIRRSYELTPPVAAVLAGLRDEDTVRRRAAADGLGGRLVRHEVSGDVVRIVVAGDVPLDWLPSAISARLGSSPTVERMEEWQPDGDGARSSLTFSFSGLPVTCGGSARLVPSGAGAGSRMDVDLDLRVDVPLFGGVVEKTVSPQIVRALDAEAAFYDSVAPGSSPPE